MTKENLYFLDEHCVWACKEMGILKRLHKKSLELRLVVSIHKVVYFSSTAIEYLFGFESF